MSGSCHLDRLSNDKKLCQILNILVVVFLNCSCEIKFGASWYRKGCKILIQKFRSNSSFWRNIKKQINIQISAQFLIQQPVQMTWSKHKTYLIYVNLAFGNVCNMGISVVKFQAPGFWLKMNRFKGNFYLSAKVQYCQDFVVF